MARRKAARTIRCAVIGYGGAFNMGKGHAQWINGTEGMVTVAACDKDPARMKAAQADFPGIATFTSVSRLLSKADFDLAVVITPHNTHAALAVQCAKAGKHVIVEKPMCITVDEADRMIRAAKAAKVMLSTFHNRRWDGDYLALREVVDKGLIGDIFHVEMFGGGYGHPGYWWRGNKKISGGAFYDWGAHYLDWLLNLVPGKVVSVAGYFHKLKWMDVTNEDHVEAMIRFSTGAVADVQLSHLARAGKTRWHILGTLGAIVDEGKSLRVTTEVAGLPATLEVKYKEGLWHLYYKSIADHLLRGAPLAVTPESSRRVIAVMEAAEKSSKTGRMMRIPHE